MYQVKISFSPELNDISKYLAATDEIFARYKMPCIHIGECDRVYGDSGDPKDIGTLYAAVGKIKRTPWIVHGICDAYFDNGQTRDTLMTNFFKSVG